MIGLGVPGFKLVQILAAYFMLCTDLKYIIPVHKACTMYAHWLIINLCTTYFWVLNYGYFGEPNPRFKILLLAVDDTFGFNGTK